MVLQDADLFPAPSISRSKFTPRSWPGITPESTATLQRIIKDSHEKWHVFFLRDYRPHNHSIHYALALWALGTDDEVIQAAYKHDCSMLLPRFKSPGTITLSNWMDHLGDDDYYGAYLDFFSEIVKKQGVNGAVKEYIFSEKANFVAGRKEDQQPEMLDRFMDGIIHSLIQVGYGLEFNVPGLVIEGLAWTAVHFNSSSGVMPHSLWKEAEASGPVASLTSRFLGLGSAETTSKKTNVHAFTILARILKDSRFDDIEAVDEYTVVYSNITDKFSDVVKEYVRQWTYDQSLPDEAERKIEELVYTNALIYGVAGWSKDGPFNTDFFHVHLVTSSLFLFNIVEILPPASIEVFLRSYFAVCLTWWIGRGRPAFDINGFYANTTTNPGPVPPFPKPHKDALPSADSMKASSPNPWLQLIQECLVVPDEHLPKTHRALSHFAEIYGGRQKGGEDFGNTELEGAGEIDGTLFVRTAVLTNERLRKEPDTDVTISAYWDRKGFYKSEESKTFMRGLPEGAS